MQICDENRQAELPLISICQNPLVGSTDVNVELGDLSHVVALYRGGGQAGWPQRFNKH
ncbi:MAG: hypothetical protein QXS16_02425 [Pyrobaculum sp.]